EVLWEVGVSRMRHVVRDVGVPGSSVTRCVQFTMWYAELVAALPHIQAGKLRALAVGSPRRVSVLPDVPTISEQGFDGFDAVSWGGLLAPAGTPPAIIDRLDRELQAILADPDVQQKLLNAGTIAHFEPAPAMAGRIASDYQKWGALAREKGMTAE